MVSKQRREILERAFRKAARIPKSKPIRIRFRRDEVIEIRVNGQLWVMEIGSDDNGFDFYNANPGRGQRDRVSFDFPQAWLDLDEREARDARSTADNG